ncbi:ABC transporter permease [Mycolicibacterium arenosum]|uniref:ABC transporter permease n=1 Tax=Mycolicibacterium arenosum TaxID=2952157 RepID=A0ABT1M182_9MYCO|nr:ABC transporter permease [Mycolicibacterium sp. CAU 1645]MCP9272024.1 ABC transporter permease [Mycolicibacterium sp. CAU 1645]
MTMLAVLNAERIKLSTIRSPLWSALLAAVLSIGVAALQGAAAYGTAGLAPEQVSIGVAVFGVPILMILSAMVVTGEYRTGMMRTTFAATPNRTMVLAVKAVVAAALSSVYSAALVLAAVVMARLTSEPLQTTRLSLTDSGVWRVAGAVALYAALAAVLGVSVGALLRHTAGAVALLLLWPLVVEPVVGNLPNFGTEVGPFLPFVNAFIYTDVPWLFPTYVMPWGPVGSLVYFAVIVGAAAAAAVIVVNRRDA